MRRRLETDQRFHYPGLYTWSPTSNHNAKLLFGSCPGIRNGNQSVAVHWIDARGSWDYFAAAATEETDADFEQFSNFKEEDRYVLRYMRRDMDSGAPLRIMQMVTLLFGAKPCLFLVIATARYHAKFKKNKKKFRQAAQLVKDDFYVEVLVRTQTRWHIICPRAPHVGWLLLETMVTRVCD